jgi:hypothetical protein
MRRVSETGKKEKVQDIRVREIAGGADKDLSSAEAEAQRLTAEQVSAFVKLTADVQKAILEANAKLLEGLTRANAEQLRRIDAYINQNP